MHSKKKDQASPKVPAKTAPRLFAWLASATLLLLIITSQFFPRGNYPGLRIIGVVTLLTAAVFIFTPFYQLTKYGRSRSGTTYMYPEKVVQQGLYAYIRHPQYFGYMLLACGFALLSQHWGAVLLAILTITFFYLQALQEERYCVTHFGTPYQRYLHRIPRFNLIEGVWRVLRGNNHD